MTATLRTPRRAHSRIAGILVAIAATFGVVAPVALTAAPASASVSAGTRALAVAPHYAGVRYVWGGTTPRGFDCSGYTKYVYARVGKYLPRTAQQQYNATIHVGKRVRPGDLVFFYSGSTRNVYHVGIYAGNGKIWHAPHTGARVRLERIWTSKWTGGRVR